MNIFLHELKANFKSLLIWSVITLFLIVVGISKFSAFAGNPELTAMLDAYPPALLDAFSMRAFNVTTVSGYFGIMFVFFPLMGAIAASMWGSEVISKEERDKTVEFALVLPVSRSRVITAKALAALVYCVLFVLITWGISLVAVQSYNPDKAFYDFLALEMVAMFLIELIFLAIGLLLGCSMKQYKKAGSTAVAIILVTYFLSVAIEINDKLNFLRYITPFKLYDAGKFFVEGKLEWVSVVLTMVIIVVSVGAAYRIYNKRDLMI